MNPTPRTMSDEDKRLIQEYLDNGGAIEQKQYGDRTEDIEYTGGFYHKKRKKKEAEAKDDE